MSYRKIIGGLFILSVVGFVVGVVFSHPESYGICEPEQYS